MSSEKPLFPDSKIEEPKPVNTHDNDMLMSPRNKNIFEKDATKQRKEDEEERIKRKEMAKTEDTGRSEVREATRRRLSA